MSLRSVTLGARTVGEGHPCLVIAEAGSNHNGSFEQALQLVDVAADAGADAVKFQVFDASRLYSKGAGKSDYLKLDESIYDVIAHAQLPLDWLPGLVAHCRERGVMFIVSVFDEGNADLVDEYVDVFKIASYEMTHTPLLQHTARKGKPVILSTGTAEMAEVAQAVGEFRATGNNALVLLQCTAAYPAPFESLNLRAMQAMRGAFDVPVGFSDHSRDPISAPLAAAALGASVIEKHFTLSNDLPGPDHRFALEPPELREMIRRIREVEQALGTGEKRAHPAEHELRQFARRSIFSIREIKQGERFSPDNIAVLRCGNLSAGLEPRAWHAVLGRAAARAIPAETAIAEGDYV